MRTLEPHTEVGNPTERRDGLGNDPVSRRARIAAKARNNPKEKFNNLIHHLTPQLIEECLSKMPSKTATGVDEMTVAQTKGNLSWLLPPISKAIHEGNYRPPPVKRIYIPKPDGRERPIGIPTVMDRAIQASMTKILNEIYEQDFQKCSFGFRPGISCHHALSTIGEVTRQWKLNYALEVDIRDFFGSLSHEWLGKFVEHRVGDERVLKLISAWLKAGIMEQGKWREVEEGTPQGGSISPLLANIYLHYVLDLWWEKRIKNRLRGKAHLVRYADDFVILFEDHQEAQTVLTLLKTRLGQFGLSVADEKTHLTDLRLRDRRGLGDRRNIKFLGFTIFRAPTRSGKGWKLVYQTDGKRFSRAKAAMKAMLKCKLHECMDEQRKAINAVLRGHYNYYGMPGNGQRLAAFLFYTTQYWRRSLSCRSQNGRVGWPDMTHRILKAYPLACPHLRVNYGNMREYVRL